MKETREPDLVEKIAKSLPLDIRAEFLNEMRYLRSLPENDELLRVLHVMMFLSHMTEQIPVRILSEREKMESVCNAVIDTAKRLETNGSEYYKQLHSRLIRLPEDVAKGINPKAIVELISDNLKRQFDLSTIPMVAGELHANAEEIKTATKQYTRATTDLNSFWCSAADKAYEAIRNINRSVSEAANTAKEATAAFTITFRKTYRRMLSIICGSALLVGIMTGMLIVDHFRPYKKTIFEITPELDFVLEELRLQRKGELTPMPYQRIEPVPRVLTPIPEQDRKAAGKRK